MRGASPRSVPCRWRPRANRNAVAATAPRPSSAAVRRRRDRAFERRAHLRRRREAIGGLFRQRPGQAALDRLGYFRAPGANRWQRRQHLLRHEGLRGRPGERRLSAQHLVEDAAEAVDVAAPVHLRRATGLLRAHVGRRADREPDLGQALAARGLARGGDAEVGHDRLVPVEQDVLGLDVAVDHPVPVRVVQPQGDLAGDADGGGYRQPTLALQSPAQGLARHVRHHVIEEPVGLAGVEQRKDMRVGKAGDGADLPEEALGSHRCRELRVDDLEGHRPVMPEIVGEEDRGGAAATQEREAPVGLPLDQVALLKRDRETLVHGHRHWPVRKLQRAGPASIGGRGSRRTARSAWRRPRTEGPRTRRSRRSRSRRPS